MDRLIYTSMTGAKHLLHRQETLANNLANANTTGFRAETVALRAVPARGSTGRSDGAGAVRGGFPSRTGKHVFNTYVMTD